MKKKDADNVTRILATLDDMGRAQMSYLAALVHKGKPLNSAVLARKFKVTQDEAAYTVDLFMHMLKPVLGEKLSEEEVRKLNRKWWQVW